MTPSKNTPSFPGPAPTLLVAVVHISERRAAVIPPPPTKRIHRRILVIRLVRGLPPLLGADAPAPRKRSKNAGPTDNLVALQTLCDHAARRRIEEEDRILVLVVEKGHILVGKNGPGEAREQKRQRDPGDGLGEAIVIARDQLCQTVRKEDVHHKLAGRWQRRRVSLRGLLLLSRQDEPARVQEMVHVPAQH